MRVKESNIKILLNSEKAGTPLLPEHEHEAKIVNSFNVDGVAADHSNVSIWETYLH